MTAVGGALAGAAAMALCIALAFLARHRWRSSATLAGSADQPENAAPPARRRRPSDPAAIAELKTPALQNWMRGEAARDRETVRQLLVYIRDACGADEAIFWQWQEHRDALRPEVWSAAEASAPPQFHLSAWAPLVQWSAQEQVVQFDTAGEEPCLAAAPVTYDDRLLGVLSVSNEACLYTGRHYLEEWLPRHAVQLATTLTLSETRRESQRQMRQSGALLEAIKQMQSLPTADALCRAICETALHASSGTASALVRWRADRATGIVQYATTGFRRRAPFDVEPGSLVARACEDNLTFGPEDSARALLSLPLFFEGDGECRTGTVAIIPVSRDQLVLGAIVVWCSMDAELSADEIENIRVLSVAATTSLEGLWYMEAAERHARTDSLTQLYNRRHFEERLQHAAAETDRFGTPTALILVDIDHFKQVNDTHGHDAGDHVLKFVAAYLKEGVRTVDTCARYGGEEFVILLPQTALNGAVDLADRLRRGLAGRPIRFKGVEIPVTASFGVSCYPEAARTRDTLVETADKALYEAKHGGRNQVKSAPVRARNEAT